MTKWTGAFFAGMVCVAPVIHAAGMPTNPFGTVFAPWNTMPGGFSPLNNGFTSGGPMGMSPFAMSPWGGNGSPWGAMPNNVMPWNAWSSGSIVPWANRLPFNNQTGTGYYPNMNGIPMPWGGTGVPSWMPFANNGYGYYRGRNRNNDTWRTMMMLNSIHGNQSGMGNILQAPAGVGSPPATAQPASPPLPVPSAPAATLARPVQPAGTAAAVTGAMPAQPAGKAFDPFARGQVQAAPTAPPKPPQAAQPAQPVAPSQPEPPKSFDPFVGGNTSESPAQAAEGGLQFPDGKLF